MKTIKPTIVKISLATGLLLGSFALSVLAQAWSPAGCTAPNCNTERPIDVGTTAQFRRGPFAVATSSVPTAGYSFEVGGSGLFTGLLVTGQTNTNTLKVTGTNADKGGYVLKNDGTGDAVWTDPATITGLGSGSNVHYITPVQVFGISTGEVKEPATTMLSVDPALSWSSISYPAQIPTTAKTVIIRSFAQTNGWQVSTYVKAANLTEMILARAFGPNNSDDAASDSVVFHLPYSSTDRAFSASWLGEGAVYRTGTGGLIDETAGHRADIFVIGYTD